jgi:hypothetical protein
MTVQTNDTCFHRKIDFQIVHVVGTGLFDPAQIGIETNIIWTDCWRGYQSHYTITGDRLHLSGVHLGWSGREADAPAIFGIRPRMEEDFGCFYEGMAVPTPFSGRLTLAVPAFGHHYRRDQSVRELLFEEGRILADLDRSTAAQYQVDDADL